MKTRAILGALASAAVASTFPITSGAQGVDEIASLEGSALGQALQQRYDAALSATLNPAVIMADDPRYLWAQQAKVQCAIALGYLESATRDATSIEKCAMAYGYMQLQPQPVMMAPPPPPPPQTRRCPDGTVVRVSEACAPPPPPVVMPMGERG